MSRRRSASAGGQTAIEQLNHGGSHMGLHLPTTHELSAGGTTQYTAGVAPEGAPLSRAASASIPGHQGPRLEQEAIARNGNFTAPSGENTTTGTAATNSTSASSSRGANGASGATDTQHSKSNTTNAHSGSTSEHDRRSRAVSAGNNVANTVDVINAIGQGNELRIGTQDGSFSPVMRKLNSRNNLDRYLASNDYDDRLQEDTGKGPFPNLNSNMRNNDFEGLETILLNDFTRSNSGGVGYRPESAGSTTSSSSSAAMFTIAGNGSQTTATNRASSRSPTRFLTPSPERFLPRNNVHGASAIGGAAALVSPTSGVGHRQTHHHGSSSSNLGAMNRDPSSSSYYYDSASDGGAFQGVALSTAPSSVVDFGEYAKNEANKGIGGDESHDHNNNNNNSSNSSNSNIGNQSANIPYPEIIQPFISVVDMLFFKMTGKRIKATTIILVLNCLGWYCSSSISSNTSKSILNVFEYPMTLTLVQFAFVAVLTRVALTYTSGYSQLLGGDANGVNMPVRDDTVSSKDRYNSSYFGTFVDKLVFNYFPGANGNIPMRKWSKNVVTAVLPLGIFQAISHIFNSEAMSRVPVSTVHTIKALSPVFTVLIYRIFFAQGYPLQVYVSLFPLTLGVMMVCIGGSGYDLIGSVFALLSTIVFVLQNIFSKKLFVAEEEHLKGPKMDKMNLMYYSAIFSFISMFPIWVISDGYKMVTGGRSKKEGDDKEVEITTLTIAYILMLFLVNGISMYLQSINAFSVLQLTSPVTYSIASLIKRIFVIFTAIIWFHQLISTRQAIGILFTFIGLYIYQDAKSSKKATGEAVAPNNPR